MTKKTLKRSIEVAEDDQQKKKRQYIKKESHRQECCICKKQFANQNCLLVHLPKHAEPEGSPLDEWHSMLLLLIRKYGIYIFSYLYGIQTNHFINQV